MPSSIESGFTVAWFDDVPETISTPLHRLKETGATVLVFETLTKTRRHFVNNAMQGADRVPDVTVADLRIEVKREQRDQNETGLNLTSFVHELYQKRLKINARLGVASGFSKEIEGARHRDDLMFVFSKDLIIGDGFPLFYRHLTMSAMLFRRDRWCRAQDDVTPLEFDDYGGRLVPDAYYGVIGRIDRETVTIQTWRLDRIRSEKVRHFPRRIIDAVGRFDFGEPVRLIDAYDRQNTGNVRASTYIQKLKGLETRATLELCRKTDFSGFS